MAGRFPGASPGPRRRALPRQAGRELTGRRRRSPNRRRRPAAATATGCYLCPGVPSPGHRWQRPPAVTTGDPAGQRSPRSAPRSLPCDGGSPSPLSPVERSRARASRARERSLAPRRPRPPRGRRGSLRESQRMKSGVIRNGCGCPWPAPRSRPARPAPGACASLRSRAARAPVRGATCSWRSSSLVPPQTPCSWCVARAYCRHWRRTRQAAQTAFALASSPAPGPCAATGKNSSGSASRQAADAPPVAPFLRWLQRGALGWQLGNNNHAQTPESLLS